MDRISKVLFGLMVLAAAACGFADAKPAAASRKVWDLPAHVTCFSGGVIFYEGDSEGTVEHFYRSEGVFFTEKDTHAFMRVNGDCTVRSLP